MPGNGFWDKEAGVTHTKEAICEIDIFFVHEHGFVKCFERQCRVTLRSPEPFDGTQGRLLRGASRRVGGAPQHDTILLRMICRFVCYFFQCRAPIENCSGRATETLFSLRIFFSIALSLANIEEGVIAHDPNSHTINDGGFLRRTPDIPPEEFSD